MRYLLLIYGDERALDDALREECDRESTLLARPIDSAGHDLAVAPRQPTSMATSVGVRQGKRLVTDGPFAETREQLGGSFLIDARRSSCEVNRAQRTRRTIIKGTESLLSKATPNSPRIACTRDDLDTALNRTHAVGSGKRGVLLASAPPYVDSLKRRR